MRRYGWLIASISLTAVMLWVWLAKYDAESIRRGFESVGWRGLVWLILCSSLNYGLRYLRWYFMVARLEKCVHGMDAVICYLSGFAFNTTPAKVGEVIRSYYYRHRHGLSYRSSLGVLVWERVLDLGAAITLACLVLYQYGQSLGIGVVACLGFLVIGIAFPPGRLTGRVSESLRLLNVKITRHLSDSLVHFIELTRVLFKRVNLMSGYSVGLLAWSIEAYAFAWLAQELGGSASCLVYMGIFGISITMGALSFVPGGLGTTEGSMYLLAVSSGMTGIAATVAVILIRVATLWYGLFLGLLSLAWLELVPVAKQELRK
ncbi:MAG: flippase-like domain-containing protein [Halioglobus sp.]|nr:flippase-like domain-containing protein [Halioglobus sp.]